MENLNIKCLAHKNTNVCFWNKCYKEKETSLLLCHKCILEKQDQISKYQDLYEVLENGFQDQDSLIYLNYQVLYERISSRRQGLITTLLKYVEELKELIQNLVSKYESFEQEIKVNMDNLYMRNELLEFKDKLKQGDWDDIKKHEEFSKIYFDGLNKGQVEYQKQMIQFCKLQQDKQLEFKIKEIQLNFPTSTQEFHMCQIIKEARKPVYQNFQIKQILYQNTQSEQFYQLLIYPAIQTRYFLFFTKTLKIVMKIWNSTIDIKQYSKTGQEKFSLSGQVEFIRDKNLLNITKSNKQSIFKLFKSLKHVQVNSKPVRVEKLIIMDQIKLGGGLFNTDVILPDEFLLQI